MFKYAKMNDRVFDYLYQEFGTVVNIIKVSSYPIKVKFDNTARSYTYNGMSINSHIMPQLFWDKVDPIVPPKRPLLDLKVNTRMIVWNNKKNKERGYFSHFDEDGKIHCFMNGATSWSTTKTIYWNNWKLADE